jgi:biotin transport system substrate-specific component
MEVKSTVLTALFAALISAGAYIAVPIGPVPVTLQTLFVLTAGILGGRRIGTAAVGIYLLAGSFGLPVFSGGSGSLAHFLGPTGGYLAACLPAVFVTGLISEAGIRVSRSRSDSGSSSSGGLFIQLFMFSAGAFAGTCVIYLIGVPWLKVVLGISWQAAAAVGMLPFLIGDGLKLVAAAVLGGMFSTRVQTFLTSGADYESA